MIRVPSSKLLLVLLSAVALWVCAYSFALLKIINVKHYIIICLWQLKQHPLHVLCCKATKDEYIDIALFWQIAKNVCAQQCFWEISWSHRIPLIYCTTDMIKICPTLLESGCRHQVKAEDICTYFLCTDIVYISEPHKENGRSTGTKGWTEQWMEKGRSDGG